jgi:hypothetical protein
VTGDDLAAREAALQLIHEGARLHYERDDDDALLHGDQLYAQGLARLAQAGDLEAIAQLADTISLVAQANAEGRPERTKDVWDTSHYALLARRRDRPPR